MATGKARNEITPVEKLHADVAAHLREAKERNDELQKNFEPGSSCWHHCETVDDRINDALGLLGE